MKKWISVRRDLPPFDQRVLALRIGYPIEICVFQASHRGLEFIDGNGCEFEADYWLDLPALPEEAT